MGYKGVLRNTMTHHEKSFDDKHRQANKCACLASHDKHSNWGAGSPPEPTHPPPMAAAQGPQRVISRLILSINRLMQLINGLVP